MEAAFEHAFAWLGFGAKTAVGYGAMEEDPAVAESRRKAIEEKRQQEQAEAKLANRGIWAMEFERPADYRKRNVTSPRPNQVP